MKCGKLYWLKLYKSSLIPLSWHHNIIPWLQPSISVITGTWIPLYSSHILTRAQLCCLTLLSTELANTCVFRSVVSIVACDYGIIQSQTRTHNGSLKWNIVIVIGCFVWCGMFHQRALLPDYARRCLEEVRPGVGPQPRSVQPPTPGAHHPRYLGHRSHSVDTGQGQWDPTGTKPKNNLP